MRVERGLQIHVPSLPGRLTISRGMMEDLLYDPVKAAYVFFQIELDAFQAAALRIAWFARVSEIHSGHGSSKTLVNGWIICNLSCVLIPGTVVGVVFQNFQAAKDNYWKYYSSAYMTPLFRAQLGRLEGETGEMKKGSRREPGSWKYHFKGGGRIEMPAPGHIGDADKLGSWEVHRMLIDESNKIRKMGEGIQKQLIGRIRLQPFSREHPVWQNKLWLLGTAETVGHPGYEAHQRYEAKVKRGNPKYWTLGFCFKDWSNITIKLGKNKGRSFRDVVPDWDSIETMRTELGGTEKWLGEGLGLWTMLVSRWYSDEALTGAEARGRVRGVTVIISRADDPYGAQAFYFLGLDPARARNSTNNDGAMMTLRALARVDEPGDSDVDWNLDYVWARRVRNYGAPEWSGMIHEKHRDFGFASMVLDLGGGGDFIEPELRKTRQKIEGHDMDVTPIVRPGDTRVIVAHQILYLLLRTDDGVRELWPELANARGSDVLKYFANAALRTGLEKQLLTLPIPHREIKKEELKTWPEEKRLASLLMTTFKSQCSNFSVQMDERGKWKMTANSVPMFTCVGDDDFHDAGRNAYVAFKIWLRRRDEVWVSKAQGSRFGGWSGKTESGKQKWVGRRVRLSG